MTCESKPKTRIMKLTTKQYKEVFELNLKAGEAIEKVKATLISIDPSVPQESTKGNDKDLVFVKCGDVMCRLLQQLVTEMKETEYFHYDGKVIPNDEKRDAIFTFANDSIYNRKKHVVIQHISDPEALEINLNNLTGLIVSFFSKSKKHKRSLMTFYQLIPVLQGDMVLSTLNIFKMSTYLKYDSTEFYSNYLEFLRRLWSSIPIHIPNHNLPSIPYEFYRQILLFIMYKHPTINIIPELINFITTKAQSVTNDLPEVVDSVKQAIEMYFNLDPIKVIAEIVPLIPHSKKRKLSNSSDDIKYGRQKIE